MADDTHTRGLVELLSVLSVREANDSNKNYLRM
jgi:hypothetical protein